MPRLRPGRALAPLLLLPWILSGCAGLFGTPALEVDPPSIAMTATSATVTVTNGGRSGTVLDVTATTSDPAVLRVDPTSAQVASGSSVTLTLTVDPVAVGPGGSFQGSLRVTSNGGNATVSVAYDTLGRCSSFQAASVAGLGAARSAPPASAAVPGQLIVGYARPSGLTAQGSSASMAATASAVRSAHGLTLLAGGAGGPDLVASADVPADLARLRADPRVRYVQRNYLVTPQAVPNDPYYATDQWNLSSFGLPEAWAIETGDSAPVTIAIIDSGVLTTHEDLAPRIVPGYDFNGDDTDPNPGPNRANGDVAHGTHVAGIAAAVGDNGAGIAGVAYGAQVRILPIKIFDDSGTNATIFDLVNAIRWAAGTAVGNAGPNPNPADIINMSVGVAGDQPAVDAASEDAWDAGVLLVAAAGNHTGTADPGVLSPGNAPCVMAVGSVDGDRSLSYFSNAGPELEVVAPGGFEDPQARYPAVLSTWPSSDSSYDLDAGTSMAAPFVAGVAALLKAHHPSWTPADLRRALDTSTLRDPGADPTRVGYGVVCADAALGASTTCGP